MNPTHSCPECGKPLPAGSDVCPACLMAQAIASRTLDDADGPREVPPPPAPEEIAEKFPQFEILECLGRGGMGVVYKARQKSLNRLVAIKILAPERERDARFAERFAKEAEMLAKLSHPHIVTIHDFGETGGLYYLVMEFINGVNLRDLLREGKMAPEQALAIVPPICDALQFAHDHGIVHRDIKPENILLDREGRVKIADFGIATLAGDAVERAGTPHYMAPEQSGGASSVDHRADIYALGVVLYEMLTGERPTTIPVAPSRRVQIDVRLDEVVLRALEATPERRFQSVGEFHTLLTQAATSEAKPTRPGTWQGVDYRSERTLLGWPLVHVSSGVDPVTGKRRVAKGWLAVGDVAHGFLAFGGLATGVFAFGGIAIGLLGYGGLALGLVALGGVAMGLLLAIGGLAVGGIAIGGMAIGYFAHGASTLAAHSYSPLVQDPAAMKFFLPWSHKLVSKLGLWNTLVLILGFGINFAAVGWAMSRTNKGVGPSSPAAGNGGKPTSKNAPGSWNSMMLHFAPAVLLIAAWLTSGLEKGAVMILSVLVVAVLTLKAVGRAKPAEVGSDATARWALGLLLGGIIGTPLLLSFTTKEEGVLFAGGACLLASLILAIISCRTRLGKTLALIWAGLFAIAAVMGVFYQSRNARVRDEALARSQSQRLETAELAAQLERELKDHRPGLQDSLPVAPSSQGAITIDGKSYPSISAALDAAPEQAVIRLGEGIYRERVVINKPVTLIGAGWEKTRIQVEGPDLAESRDDESPEALLQAMEPAAKVATGGSVTLTGISFSMTGAPREGGLAPVSLISAGKGQLYLNKCALIGSVGNGIEAKDTDLRMNGCLVAAAWNTGIVLGESAYAEINDCTVRNCYYAGIVIRPRSGTVGILNCCIAGSAWHGIQYDQDCAPVITGNVIQHHAQNGIIAIGNTKGEITGNVIADNETAGITLRDNSLDRITRNLFIGNRRESIFLADKSSPEIRGNIFSGKGILQQPAGRTDYGSPVVAQNVFWDMTRPWERWTEKGPAEFPLPEGNRVEDPKLDDETHALPAGSPLTYFGIGPADPPRSGSPFPIQPEETAIIPDGDTRDSKAWKRPK